MATKPEPTLALSRITIHWATSKLTLPAMHFPNEHDYAIFNYKTKDGAIRIEQRYDNKVKVWTIPLYNVAFMVEEFKDDKEITDGI